MRNLADEREKKAEKDASDIVLKKGHSVPKVKQRKKKQETVRKGSLKEQQVQFVEFLWFFSLQERERVAGMMT